MSDPLHEINRQLGELIGMTNAMAHSHDELRNEVKDVQKKVDSLSVSDAAEKATNKAHRSMVVAVFGAVASLGSSLILWFVKSGGHSHV